MLSQIASIFARVSGFHSKARIERTLCPYHSASMNVHVAFQTRYSIGNRHADVYFQPQEAASQSLSCLNSGNGM